MKRILIICMTVLATPGYAQDEGKSLMERGAELFLEGLREEMEPTLNDLADVASQFGPAVRSFVAEMGPALVELGAQVRDWSRYEAPEMLPNGDIIIRKKPDIEEPDVPEESPAPDVDPDEGTDI